MIVMSLALTYVIVPTFRECSKVAQLLACFAAVRHEGLRILIANGDPGDETSRYLRELGDARVIEIAGHPGLYWSGLVNLGLRHALQAETPCEYVIIMNADVVFDGDVITPLIRKARATPNTQLAAVTVAGGRVVSSGVKIVSWLLTINRHPLAGTLPTQLPNDDLVPVDFLPTRCTLIPFEYVKKAGLIAEAELPHYGGDNEYTNRVRRLGCAPCIFTGVQVQVDAGHTGTDVFHRQIPIGKRIRSLFALKSTANPIYRIRFVRMAYPWYAWPSAIVLYTLRSILEVLLGGNVIKFIIRRKESGFSGS